jgi:uncharacterized membrane protein
MNLAPLFEAGPAIQIHVAAATVALVLTPVQLLRLKGTHSHRAFGYCWMAAMTIVALTSFFIHTIGTLGPFSPIHILSVMTLVTVPRAVLSARAGNVALHRRQIMVLVWLALVGAGLFTLLPGRIMHAVAFGS